MESIRHNKNINFINNEPNNYSEGTSSFKSICVEHPLNDEEEKTLLIHSNNGESTIGVTINYYVEIKPGKRIVVKEEGLSEETVIHNLDNRFTNIANDDMIIDNEVDNFKGTGTENFINTYKFFSEIKILNEQHEKDIEEIDNLKKQLDFMNNELGKIKEEAIDSCRDIKNEEDINMKKSIMYDVLKEQLKFLMTAVSFIIIALIGIIVFATTGKYLIHPYLYIILLLMGSGWALTAIFSIRSNKV